jgi:3-oxoacyl-[acyl-carrier protein] reductase
MANTLKGKVAIVTGSGQGIGRAVAHSLGAEGAIVITNNRKAGTKGGDADATAKEIIAAGGQAAPYYCDISSFSQCEKMVKFATDKFGRLDILINNGGADAPHMIFNMTEEDWDLSLDTYLKGAFNLTHFAAGIMRDQKWGRLINTTSSAWLGTVGHSNYGAAKAGLVGFTRSIARELGRWNITCNAFAPRAATRFTLDEDVRAGYKKRFAAGLITKAELDARLGMPTPEGIGPFIAYLCTKEAGIINGQVFHVEANTVSIYSEPVEKYHIKKDTMWTVEELIKTVPSMLKDYKNPAPPQEDKK